MHKNARTTPLSRAMIVHEVLQEGHSRRAVATARRLSEKTIRKWLKRHARGGDLGLEDRSSKPRSVVPVPKRRGYALVLKLRRQRCSYAEIALRTGLSRATLSRWLRQVGLNRLKSLEPTIPVIRYERENPGELLHLDIKKLGRIERVGHRITGTHADQINGAGWEYLHVVIDDHSRVGWAEIYPNEKGPSAVSFLKAAVAYYASFAVKVTGLMTDNGACYRSDAFKETCRKLRIKHIFTRPYTPRTNGKAERFIQTALKEWAYVHAYSHSLERTATLPLWLHRYNWHRPHQSLNMNPPASRLPLSADNLVRLHT
jgi:transposase InsO family protein